MNRHQSQGDITCYALISCNTRYGLGSLTDNRMSNDTIDNSNIGLSDKVDSHPIDNKHDLNKPENILYMYCLPLYVFSLQDCNIKYKLQVHLLMIQTKICIQV